MPSLIRYRSARVTFALIASFVVVLVALSSATNTLLGPRLDLPYPPVLDSDALAARSPDHAKAGPPAPWEPASRLLDPPPDLLTTAMRRAFPADHVLMSAEFDDSVGASASRLQDIVAGPALQCPTCAGPDDPPQIADLRINALVWPWAWFPRNLGALPMQPGEPLFEAPVPVGLVAPLPPIVPSDQHDQTETPPPPNTPRRNPTPDPPPDDPPSNPPVDPTPVPEPTTLLLAVCGLSGLTIARRLRNRE